MEMVAQRAASASLSATSSWPRNIAHGPEVRPALLQAFSSAGSGAIPGRGQLLGPDGAPAAPTAAQRLAQLQRSIAARGGSTPSPSNSWGRSVSQVHCHSAQASVIRKQHLKSSLKSYIG